MAQPESSPIPRRPLVSNDGTQVDRFGGLRPRGLKRYMPPLQVDMVAPTTRHQAVVLTHRNNIRWFVEMPAWVTGYSVTYGRWALEFGQFVPEATVAANTTSKEFLQEYRGDPLAFYVHAITGTAPGGDPVDDAVGWMRIWYGSY